jgi:coenzyme F420 hydrogenase subunit beta
MKLKNVREIAAWRLCVGCGACSYICPDDEIQMVNITNEGIRASCSADNCDRCTECIEVCPGYEVIHDKFADNLELIPELKTGWGPVLEVWEGYAADKEVRYNGSSGGLASALALYCIEKEGMEGVLHTGADKKEPLKNKTVFSTRRDDILARSGSRYAPASPCDSLDRIENSSNPCVFIGKPCDIAGLRKAQSLREILNDKVGVAIGIFCAGTPSTQGTLDLLKEFKINPGEIEDIRYRGKGWPGNFSVRLKNGEAQYREILYTESWGFLQKYRPYRCYLCPDGTSELADISCGDPWYREIKEDETGYSLVLVRTEKGRRIVHGAMETGYVVLEQADPEVLVDSQKNLLSKRGAIWGRLLTMKAFGIPTPRYEGFSLFKNWLGIPLKEKMRSILGTARRIIQRKYYKRNAEISP